LNPRRTFAVMYLAGFNLDNMSMMASHGCVNWITLSVSSLEKTASGLSEETGSDLKYQTDCAKSLSQNESACRKRSALVRIKVTVVRILACMSATARRDSFIRSTIRGSTGPLIALSDAESQETFFSAANAKMRQSGKPPLISSSVLWMHSRLDWIASAVLRMFEEKK
jgi:hypothetical protein